MTVTQCPCSCCPCGPNASQGKGAYPLVCLVPRDNVKNQKPGSGSGGGGGGGGSRPRPPHPSSTAGFQIIDEDYLRKHFNFPQRSLYLDPFRRPLITFPMTQENARNFNLARKTKINQQILDGFLDGSMAITAPSVFPYGKTEAQKKKEADDDEEIIYILQLPDWESKCPVHNEVIRTPRFIWHSCKKSDKSAPGELKQGGGPLNKPKPWLLSRHTDFDLLSQW